jgi:UDP-N-acetylmuramate: L-alanyl-gamma-D-glutamyl-meso-diaminopimelate ligase
MNNLEFDHADIFDDLEAIQRQFHHLVRTVPGHGLIISPLNDGNLHDVLDRGCWTPFEHFDPTSRPLGTSRMPWPTAAPSM